MTGGREPVNPGLLRLAAAGDAAAWEELVAAYAARVYAYARSHGLSEDAADDLTQNCFLRIVGRLRDYQESGRFEHWLFTIARNLVTDHHRAAAKHKSSSGESLERELAPHVPMPADVAGAERLEVALSELNEAERELIRLRYGAELTFPEMAEVVGEKVNTLLARHKRALDKLRRWYAEAGEEDD